VVIVVFLLYETFVHGGEKALANFFPVIFKEA